MTNLPEPDRLPDVPHPRETQMVFGHADARAELLSAINSDRLHHGWMITGPDGIGKATLAYQAAATILAKPAADGGFFGDNPEPVTELSLPPSHPIQTRIRAGSEPGLFVLRRPVDPKTEKLKSVITVDEVRKLRNFFAMSADGNGHRVVIVDAVDDLNVQAANALLKMLEEPPAGAIMFLVTHRPGAVLPTIRSRCRVLNLHPLQEDDLKQACAQAAPNDTFAPGLQVLAQGSVGRAIILSTQGGLAQYTTLVDVLSSAPRIDREKLMKLADTVTARGNDGGMDQFAAVLEQLLSRLARASVLSEDIQVCPGERDLFARLNPSAQTARIWANLQQKTGEDIRSGLAVNLDPVAMILDTAFKIEETANRTLR